MNAVVLSPRSPKETSLRSYWFFVKAIEPAIAKTTELDDPVDKALRMFSIKLRK